MKNFFFIKVDGRYTKIDFSEIIYVEGSRNYSKIITESKNHLILLTMKRIEQFLPQELFKRIHKSYIVSLSKIKQFDKGRVWLKDIELPVGEQYKSEIENSVLIINYSENYSSFIGKSKKFEPVVINNYNNSKLIKVK